MCCHLTVVRMAIIKILQIINAAESKEKKESPYTIDGYINWYSHYVKLYGASLRD